MLEPAFPITATSLNDRWRYSFAGGDRFAFRYLAARIWLCSALHFGGGEWRTRQAYLTEATTMMTFAILSLLAAIGVLCWLSFTPRRVCAPAFIRISSATFSSRPAR